MPRTKTGKSLFLFLVTFSASPQTFGLRVVSRRNLAIVSEGKSNWSMMAKSGGSAEALYDNPAQEVRGLDYNIVVSKLSF